MSLIEKKGKNFFASAGIEVGGKNSWDIQVHNEKFFSRLFRDGIIAVGESYVDGWWDCESIDQFIYKCLKKRLDQKIKIPVIEKLQLLKSGLFNEQRKLAAKNDIAFHYDLGNELFESMLDKRMTYTCGYWKEADSLNDAQEAKLDLICRKLKLKEGMKVLDIGCGFGSFAKYAAEKYNVSVVGLNISKRQSEYAKKSCKGLNVKIRIEDYREHKDKYDRVVSVGMIEHVGYRNYHEYMRIVDGCMVDDGMFLLHSIGTSWSETRNDPWLDKYIFPGSMSPSVKQIADSTEGVFDVRDWHNFGKDYDKTLLAWHNNFCSNWNSIKNNYDERFFRMWNFYLLCCAAAFRVTNRHLWQVVLFKCDSDVDYKRVS